MPLTSVSGMHVTGRLKLSDPPSEGTPRRVTQLSQYGGNLTIVLEVQFHGCHAFFTRVHGHPPFWSRILSAHPFVHFRSGDDTRSRHSSYTRLLMDLHADGRTVNIQLLGRRFRCRNPACRRRVVAERFPPLVRPHARRTERLENLLTRIGVLLGGEAGARLSQDLHVPVSPDTMLRLLYRMELTPVVGLRVVGIDEWAWRKGLRYGTIVCDLEAGRPVE